MAKKSSGVSGILSAFVGEELVSVVAKAADEGVNVASKYANAKVDAMGVSVEVPDIYRPNHPLKLDEVRGWLEEHDLKCIEVVAKPSPDFHGYSENDVVGSSHKGKQKVKSNERITVYYLSLEALEESEQMFLDAEAQKLAKKEEIKQKANALGANILGGVSGAADKASKGLGGIAGKFGKNKDKE